MVYQKKLEHIMEYIQEEALWMNSFSDIYYGSVKSLPVDANNNVNIKLPQKKHYNSVLLFTVLACLQKPRASLMYTGGPGIGKTTVAEYVGHFIFDIPIREIQNGMIQCNPEATEEKMIARLDTGALIKEGKEVVIPRKFIDCPIHMLDEINRLPADKADILYNAVDRGLAKYMDALLDLTPGPIFATANYKDAGNFVMTPPFIDRFELAVKVPVPNALDLEFITDRDDEDLEKLIVTDDLKLTEKDRDKIWQEMKAMQFSKDARNYLQYVASQINFCMKGASSEYNNCAPAFMTKGNCESKRPDTLCSKCHYHNLDMVCKLTENELSVRAIKATYKYSKALAWFFGQDEVTIETVKNVIPYTTWHRLVPTNSAYKLEQGAFVNDKIALVNYMIKKVEDGFNKAGKIFDSWGSIDNAFKKIEKGKMTPEELMKIEEHAEAEVSQHDDPVKYALACWLQKIHNYVVTTYKPKKKK